MHYLIGISVIESQNAGLFEGSFFIRSKLLSFCTIHVNATTNLLAQHTNCQFYLQKSGSDAKEASHAATPKLGTLFHLQLGHQAPSLA
mgnify:CR=1 FL=1